MKSFEKVILMVAVVVTVGVVSLMLYANVSATPCTQMSCTIEPALKPLAI